MSIERDIQVLLRDYNDYLPAGSGVAQEAVPYVGGGGFTSHGWPLTPEALRRMDPRTLIGETYMLLDAALRVLSKRHPDLYLALYFCYMRDDVGHSDVDWMRTRPLYRELVKKHDEAIKVLSRYLEPVRDRLYVRYPRIHAVKDRYQTTKERNEELYAVYLRYRREGMKHSKAVEAAAVSCDYTVRHAWNVIKAKQGDEKGMKDAS